MPNSDEEHLTALRNLRDRLLERKLAGEHVVSYSTPGGHRVTRQPVTQALNDIEKMVREYQRKVDRGTINGGYAQGRVVH